MKNASNLPDKLWKQLWKRSAKKLLPKKTGKILDFPVGPAIIGCRELYRKGGGLRWAAFVPLREILSVTAPAFRVLCRLRCIPHCKVPERRDGVFVFFLTSAKQPACLQ